MTPPNGPGPVQDERQASGARTSVAERSISLYLVPIVIGVFVTILLWLVSQYNFALYHTTVEFATIAISLAIFLLVWNSRKIIDNNYLLFIGVTFIFIAGLDFLHTLVYQGVGIFPYGGGVLSTRFWIAARYMQAVTLLAAPLFLRRKLRLDVVAVVYLVADILIVSSIFYFQVFPATYIPETGLTPFKIISEYIISFILIGAIVLLYRNRDSFDRDVLNNLVVAILLTILAELSFTEYASFTDIFSLLGHVFRLVSFYFFYRAIIQVGQEKPYALLYRNLNESEKKYRALSDLSPDAIIVVRDGIVQYANEAGLHLSGIDKMEQFIGSNVQDFIHPDDWAESDARIAAVQEKQVIIPLRELRVIRNGKIVPVEATSGPIAWEGEDAVQVVLRDITERKRAYEAIAELNRDRKTILDNMPAMIWYKDTQNNFIRVNSAVEKYTGLSADMFEGNNASAIFPDESDLYYQDDLGVMKSGTPRYGIVERLTVAGGGKIWIQTDKIPLRDEKGNITGILVFSLDITKRKQAEDDLAKRNAELSHLNEELTETHEELQQNLDELSQRERELSDNEARLKEALAEKEILLSEIHHRVKNNLTAFISLLSLDGSYEETDAGRALRKDLQNRARSMALIHETLYRTGKFSNVDMDLYLTTLIGQISASYSGTVAVQTEIDVKGMALGLARATTAGLIINELVTNSFKYAFPPGYDCMQVRGEPCKIRISLKEEDGINYLRVSDNGCGLPAEIDPATTKSLGLKLVAFLTSHQLHAEIEVRSDKGTEFVFRMNN